MLDVVEKIADLAERWFVRAGRRPEDRAGRRPGRASGARPGRRPVIPGRRSPRSTSRAPSSPRGEGTDRVAVARSSRGRRRGEDFTYPVFDKPGCLVGLLLGNDCVIVEWRPDRLHVKASYPLSFGPFFGVLYVTFGGEIEANGNFGAGVSTRGIRMLGERIARRTGRRASTPSGASKVFFQSLYLVDHDASGKDVPEFEVAGRSRSGAKFDALIVAAGVDGGITATFSLNLNDTPAGGRPDVHRRDHREDQDTRSACSTSRASSSRSSRCGPGSASARSATPRPGGWPR